MNYSLQQCEHRIEEIDRSLMDPKTLSNPAKFRELTKERAHLEPMVNTWKELEQARQELEDAKEMLSDPEMKEMAEMEIDELKEKIRDWRLNSDNCSFHQIRMKEKILF